jgi:hypothetical protein
MCSQTMRFPSCSSSTTVGIGLANGGWFGLTLSDNINSARLMLSANGRRLADNGLDNNAPGSRLLTIDDSDLRMGQCPQPARSSHSSMLQHFDLAILLWTPTLTFESFDNEPKPSRLVLDTDLESNISGNHGAIHRIRFGTNQGSFTGSFLSWCFALDSCAGPIFVFGGASESDLITCRARRSPTS